MHIAEMHCALIANHQQIRNFANNYEDLAVNDTTSTGIKAPCLLNDIQHFHVMTNYVPDVMHDLLEGICGLVHPVLRNLIPSGFFDLDLLNSRITESQVLITRLPIQGTNLPQSALIRSQIQMELLDKLHRRCGA
jgi:hypothetical protein